MNETELQFLFSVYYTRLISFTRFLVLWYQWINMIKEYLLLIGIIILNIFYINTYTDIFVTFNV